MTIHEFENIWIDKIKNELLKKFPSDYIEDNTCEKLKMPGKPLVKGPELFGSFEIIDTEGNTFLQTDNIYKLKYILYANKNIPHEIFVPSSEIEFKTIVKLYETDIDILLKKVETDFKKTFNSAKEFNIVSNNIFSAINLFRH